MSILQAHSLNIPPLGLGTYQLVGKQCVEIIQRALDLGYRHIDTAAYYKNEAEIGLALRQSSVPRSDVFITTKVWPDNFRAADFRKSVERSLIALGTDYIDLVHLHWPNDAIPLEETLFALEALIDEGKVVHGGLSNFSASQIGQVVEHFPGVISAIQLKCHLGAVPFAHLRTARQFDLTATAYSPLGKGVVHADFRLDVLAQKHACSSSQIALRWMTQQGVAVIPKTSNKIRLAENIQSMEITLSDDDLHFLGRI